ncbi:MAG: diguanylate cyclase [Candidatus Omnitrophica bacterium]|nr:diguanylate cyclase [Candidatus Omnitrophota bacterium]MDD5081706.1 diguanylate cyclase [Candidatus Omnitrophota bacterium]MDD5441162.1 diguanylate cyclase [Candidatus Omnitrophota bacterium]
MDLLIFFTSKTSTSLEKKIPVEIKKTTSKNFLIHDASAFIIDECSLKHFQTLNKKTFEGKTCFLYTAKSSAKVIKLAKKLGFFDILSADESQESVNFKMLKLKKFLKMRSDLETLSEDIQKKEKIIKNINMIDPLTGTYNWRHFSQRAKQEISRARRHLYHLSFAIIDIDYFRQINEIYGLKVGDMVIKDIVKILNSCLRQDDILARWREDEFFMILPYSTKDDTYRIAQRIKSKISKRIFKYKKAKFKIKVSLGVVSFPEDKIFNLKDIINSLDSCLISAKRKGGDTVIYSLPGKNVKHQKPEKHLPTVGDLRKKIDKMNVLLLRDLLEMIYGFARAIEAKDEYTGKHVEDTSVLAESIAKELNLSKVEIANIKRAAVLHDLGKVGICQSILCKKGPLTTKERKIVNQHPWLGSEILKEIHVLRGAIPAILYHHERYDGKGYPLGLKGEEIPLSARIVSVADVYQALISDRPYRKHFSKAEAKKIMKAESGKQFDPEILDKFFKLVTYNKINLKK